MRIGEIRAAKDIDFKVGQEYTLGGVPIFRRFVKNGPDGLHLVDSSGCPHLKDLGSGVQYALVKDVGPTPFGQLSDEEKSAILLAQHEGKPIEFYSRSDSEWKVRTSFSLKIYDNSCYRVKPEPEVSEVVRYVRPMSAGGAVIYMGTDSKATHKLSFNIVDGVVDGESVKLKEL